MAIRLIEMHRILKDTGSIYLHCDPTMSHYLKILMDLIFGEKSFRNEIVWHYSKGHYPKKDFRKKHDIIFRYGLSSKIIYNIQTYKHLDNQLYRFNFVDEKGGKYRINHTKDKKGEYKKFYLNDGVKIDDNWSFLREKEFDQLPHNSKEKTGYPTQKPIALLERIIKASSNKGDVVLDPFCGCATTCVASEKLDRQWIGIDVSHMAYDLVRQRLKNEVKKDLFDPDKETKYTTVPPKRTDTNGDDNIVKKYVYVVSHPQYKGLYKVGIAKDWKSRLNSYQTSDPLRQYKMEYKHLTPLFRETEKHIHDIFDNLGEWVQASLENIKKEIENYK